MYCVIYHMGFNASLFKWHVSFYFSVLVFMGSWSHLHSTHTLTSLKLRNPLFLPLTLCWGVFRWESLLCVQTVSSDHMSFRKVRSKWWLRWVYFYSVWLDVMSTEQRECWILNRSQSEVYYFFIPTLIFELLCLLYLHIFSEWYITSDLQSLFIKYSLFIHFWHATLFMTYIDFLMCSFYPILD